MEFFGPAAANSIAAQNIRARIVVEARKSEEKTRTARNRGDEAVLEAEAVEAARSLKGNAEEEAREDHQEHPAYSSPKGSTGRNAHGHADEDRPRIDLEG